MAERSTVSIEKKSLQRLAFVVPLVSAFLYLSYQMLFGPCTISLQGLKVTGDLDFRFTSPDGKPLLSGHFDFGHPRPDSMDYGQTIIDRMDYCSSEYEYNTGCIEETHNQRIRITYERTSEGECYSVVREGLRCPTQEVKDCFDMRGAHWYGGFQSHTQPWPLDKSQLASAPYISTDLGSHGLGIGGVLERFFFNSNGVGIFVAHEVPLFVSLNPLGDHRLCFSARYDEGYYRNGGVSLPVLNYTICHAANVRKIYNYMSRRFISHPQDIPDSHLFRHPVWSTWAMFSKNITQEKVLSFAANITRFNFPASQLEIDDEWTHQYGDLEFDENKFPDAAAMEVRVGWASQSLPIIVRIFDRRSAWEAHEGGLQTVIPAVLTAGLVGYPFILPDMIGGSGAYMDQTFGLGKLPDRELFVRWLELNALMPTMQFSVPPWYYDDEVVNISRHYIELHQAYSQTILELAQESVLTGYPIIRPLWWVAPEDDVALTISSQFLLGNSVLVAPVLVRGARRRDIYLPEGTWEDKLRGDMIQGPVWLHDYEVLLEELPLFEKH
ncbi:hypothetical protein C0Q70_02257 [Pomacea canaliculata]|uniref:Uncharacterized protein n=1 Tax=Pomacea canaliculata TaxID=400727 RepID=A0A2T7PPJ3_POMCA|nr:hypothetical protein C0Q70_02257 [Pomacea canaliculata]